MMPRPLVSFSKSVYLIQFADTNSNTEWQTVQIQISLLLQKSTDLNLHCLQWQDISEFSRTRVTKHEQLHLFFCLFSKIELFTLFSYLLVSKIPAGYNLTDVNMLVQVFISLSTLQLLSFLYAHSLFSRVFFLKSIYLH